MAKKKNAKVLITLLISLVVIGGAGYSTWRIMQLRTEVADVQSSLADVNNELEALKSDIVTNPDTVVLGLQQEKNATILKEVGEVYAIPEDETPTIATVQDISKLTDQPFFDGAENGDILIVFDESGQAILYRPSEKKLVKVGPINIQENSIESSDN